MLSPLIAGNDFGPRMMVWIDGAAEAIEYCPWCSSPS